MTSAKQTTIRLGDEDLAILDEIQRRTGLLTRSDALRFALRQYARAEGIPDQRPTSKRKPKR
jgi:metal-responsive CopG/Arc/MetJ family transcriptional regulator